MTINLRPYQQDVKDELIRDWSNHPNQIAVMPCGSGKTVLFSSITDDFDGSVALIVHRQELVAQISLTLAMFGIKHDIVAPRGVVSDIVKRHVKKVGASFYSPRSNKKVGGVDTLIRRKDHEFSKWCKSVGLWIQDECHHVLQTNKWGKAAAMFTNARGLGVTATPERADGKGLGRWADGVFDRIVEGPDLRWMIDQGYLTDYRIFAPPSDVDFSGLKPTASGDYNSKALREREKNSHIFGDVVDHFNRIAPGKQGITFASNLKSAVEFARAFEEKGISARMVSGESKDRERFEADRMFRSGELRQMTNVDLFGEGYDLPVLDCVTMARKTESFALFVQQSTRALRPSYAPGMPLDTREQRLAAIAQGPKPIAYIIDHVGNVERHAVCRDGVIDLCYRDWTLDRRERRKQQQKPEDSIPTKTCTNPACVAVYEAILPACPFCGSKPQPAQRKEPEQVDGDLAELDPKSLKQITTEINRINSPFYSSHLTGVARAGAQNKHRERQQAGDELREVIAVWAGRYRAQGETDQTICKRFFYRFSVDVLSCQTKTAREMRELSERIRKDDN